MATILQIKALNAQVSQLALAAGRQTAENQQKVLFVYLTLLNHRLFSYGSSSVLDGLRKPFQYVVELPIVKSGMKYISNVMELHG